MTTDWFAEISGEPPQPEVQPVQRVTTGEPGPTMMQRVNAKLPGRQESGSAAGGGQVDWAKGFGIEQEGAQPPPQAEEQGFLQSIWSAVTGEGKKQLGVSEFDLPMEVKIPDPFEIIERVKGGKLFEPPRQVKAAAGLMTTFEDKKEMAILKENYPDLKFSEDEQGNVLVDGSAYGGEIGYLNKPGISLRDVADVGFQIAAFTPAGKAGIGAVSMLPKMARVGAAAATTQAGMDIAGQLAGATEDVSISNIDKMDILVAGIGGAAFEGIGVVAAKMLPTFKKTAKEVTNEVRKKFQTAAKEQGIPTEQVTDDVIKSFMDLADEAVDIKAMGAEQRAREFGIPYTKGQALDDIKQLSLEDTLRHGGLGAKAEETMRAFEKGVQEPAIKRARAGVQVLVGKGKRIIEAPVAMGEVVREGVKGKAAALDDAIGEAYEAVGDAYLSPDSMSKMAGAVLKASKSKEFITGNKATSAFINDVKKFKQVMDKTPGVKLSDFHISEIEAMRRKIGGYIGSAENATDRMQMNVLKRTFDDFVDGAIDNALFTGDEGAVAALKKARSLRAEYAKKFQRRDVITKSGRKIKDAPGEVMERIIAADPTDEQVANYIFGATKVGGKQDAPKIAKKIKETMGVDSKEWQSIREAAFLKLTDPGKGKDVTSGRMFANRLDEALRESPTLMNELFSKKEQGLLMRFASAIKKAQPEIKNPSKTAYKASQILQQAWEQTITALGYGAGGVPGAIAGKAAVKSGGVLAGMRSAHKARKAIRGVQTPLRSLNLGGPGAVAAVAAAEE